MGTPFGIWTFVIGIHVLMLIMFAAGWIFWKKNKDLF